MVYMLVCFSVFYLPSGIKKTCTSLLKSPNDNNNYTYDVRYSTAYTKLQYQ